jgi:predicted Zn-dependent peptidase
MRRVGGLFSCEASVQTDATAVALAEVVREMHDVQAGGAVAEEELRQARSTLTRGYGRHFETAGQLVRAMADLATYHLPDDTFDRFVPAVEALVPAQISDAAQRYLHPHDATLVVVGDRDKLGASLESLGRPVVDVAPEF